MMTDKRKTARDAATYTSGRENTPVPRIEDYSGHVKGIVAGLRQTDGARCPRCGQYPIVTHVASAKAKVYVCDQCIAEEHDDKKLGRPGLLLTEWDYIRRTKE